jgi:hypothetical protein
MQQSVRRGSLATGDEEWMICNGKHAKTLGFECERMMIYIDKSGYCVGNDGAVRTGIGG